MDESLRVTVSAAGRGYLAENVALSISAGGASPLEAAEKARSIAYAVLRQCREDLPATITAFIEDEHTIAVVRHPFQRSIDPAHS